MTSVLSVKWTILGPATGSSTFSKLESYSVDSYTTEGAARTTLLSLFSGGSANSLPEVELVSLSLKAEARVTRVVDLRGLPLLGIVTTRTSQRMLA